MPRPRGPRGGDADTRADIVEAARSVFIEHGFERGSFRAIARHAGVDPALVHHYFDSKPELFLESLRPLDPKDVDATLFAGATPEQMGERVLRAYLSVWDGPETQPGTIAILKAATVEPQIAAVLRGFLQQIFGAALTRAGSDQPEVRGAACASQLVGLALARYVIGVEPLASMTPDQLVPLYAPTLQRYLTGELDC